MPIGTYVCFDNDMAGKRATLSAIEKNANCSIIVFPEGIKDADEFIHKGGDMKSLIENAITPAEFIMKQDWISNIEKLKYFLKFIKNNQ